MTRSVGAEGSTHVLSGLLRTSVTTVGRVVLCAPAKVVYCCVQPRRVCLEMCGTTACGLQSNCGTAAVSLVLQQGAVRLSGVCTYGFGLRP